MKKSLLLTLLIVFSAATVGYAANVNITSEDFEGYNLKIVRSNKNYTVTDGTATDTLTLKNRVINSPGGNVYTEKSEIYEGNAAENIITYAKLDEENLKAVGGGLGNGWRGRYSHPIQDIAGKNAGATVDISETETCLGVVKDGADNQSLKITAVKNSWVSTWSDYAYPSLDITETILWKSDIKIGNITSAGEFVVGVAQGEIAEAPILKGPNYESGRNMKPLLSFLASGSIMLNNEEFAQFETDKYYTLTIKLDGKQNEYSVVITDKESGDIIAESEAIPYAFGSNMSVYYTAKNVKKETGATYGYIDNLKIEQLAKPVVLKTVSEVDYDGSGVCIVEFSENVAQDSVDQSTVKLYDGDIEVAGIETVVENGNQIRIILPELEPSAAYTVKINGVVYGDKTVSGFSANFTTKEGSSGDDDSESIIMSENFNSYNLSTVTNTNAAYTIVYPGQENSTLKKNSGVMINAPGGTVYTEKNEIYEGNAAENIIAYADIGDNTVLAVVGGLNNGWRGRYSHPMKTINGEGSADAELSGNRRRLAVVSDGDNQVLKINPAKNKYVSTWSDFMYENLDLTVSTVWESDIKFNTFAENGEFTIGVGKGTVPKAEALKHITNYLGSDESRYKLLTFSNDGGIYINGVKYADYELGKYYKVSIVFYGGKKQYKVIITDKLSGNTVVEESAEITVNFSEKMNIYYTARTAQEDTAETSVYVDNIKLMRAHFEASVKKTISNLAFNGSGKCYIDFDKAIDPSSASSETVKLFDGENEVSGTEVSIISDNRICISLPELKPSSTYTIKLVGIKNRLGLISNNAFTLRTVDTVANISANLGSSGVSFKLRNNTNEECSLTVAVFFIKNNKIMSQGTYYKRITIAPGAAYADVFDSIPQAAEAESAVICYLNSAHKFTAISPFVTLVK